MPDLRRKPDRLFYEQVVAHLPYKEGGLVRRWYLKRSAALGTGSIVHEHVHLIAPWNLKLGDGSAVAPWSILDCRGGLTIGRKVMVGIRSIILTTAHGFDRLDVPMADQGMTEAPVVIEDDVWIGANVVIQPGITVGRGAILGTGSVITKDVPEYAVMGGVPARLIRRRGEPSPG